MRIMTAPYAARDGWIICAAKWTGSIYLCEFLTEQRKLDKANETPREKTMRLWGHKFEQYVLTDSPDELPNTSRPLITSEYFVCCFQSRLTEHSLLYGAEMDGVESDEKLTDPLPLDELKFVEVKTRKIVENDRDLRSLERYKFLSWFCQNFIVGIRNVLCGFKDDNGIVRYLENYDIFDMARRAQRYWSAPVVMNFTDHFLKYVARNVTNDCDRSIYKFEKIPFGDIVMTEMPPTPEYEILPSWYTESS